MKMLLLCLIGAVSQALAAPAPGGGSYGSGGSSHGGAQHGHGHGHGSASSASTRSSSASASAGCTTNNCEQVPRGPERIQLGVPYQASSVQVPPNYVPKFHAYRPQVPNAPYVQFNVPWPMNNVGEPAYVPDVDDFAYDFEVPDPHFEQVTQMQGMHAHHGETKYFDLPCPCPVHGMAHCSKQQLQQGSYAQMQQQHGSDHHAHADSHEPDHGHAADARADVVSDEPGHGHVVADARADDDVVSDEPGHGHVAEVADDEAPATADEAADAE